MAYKIPFSTCSDTLIPVRDALDVLSGKWKIPLIISIRAGNNRFTAIQESIPGITPKVLAKELKEMEIHQLITREVASSYPIIITYSLTDYASSLKPIITALKYWGQNHKNVLFRDKKSL